MSRDPTTFELVSSSPRRSGLGWSSRPLDTSENDPDILSPCPQILLTHFLASFTGRSSGKGALALWMWNLKSVEVLEQYSQPWYSGPALKLGAGTIAGEAYLEAHKAGYTLVGGECPSVSVAGGYSQGGGHSILGTAYGMGADQVLEWEVVTASGEHLIATPVDNADLYWALSGGGGGTYGVVLSVTVRAFRDFPIAGGSLMFLNTNDTAFWEAVDQWMQQAPTLVGENNTIFWVVQNTYFATAAITLPGQPESAVTDLLDPFLAHLRHLNLDYTLSTRYSASYLEHFNTSSFGPLPYGPGSSTSLNSRIVPDSILESTRSRAGLLDVIRATVNADSDFLVGCGFMNSSKGLSNSDRDSHPIPDNSVLPAWRDTVMGCNINVFWHFDMPLEKNHALKAKLVEDVMPAIEAATPGGGVYLNEMDPWYKGDWKRELYGVNYERLLDTKHKYDPENVFWGTFLVASDELSVDEEGRLCGSAT